MRGRNSSYDSLISPYDYEDFSFSKLKERYKIWTGSALPDKCFESFGIRDAKGRLTNAGALLADEAPVYWSRLFCTRWNGLDKSGGQFDALDSAEYSGSLLILLNEGMSFVKRNMKTLWKKPPFNSNRTEFTVTLPNLNFKASPGGAFSEALTDNQKLLAARYTARQSVNHAKRAGA